MDLLFKVILVWFLSFVFIFARALYKKLTTKKDELKKENEQAKEKENDCIAMIGARKYNLIKIIILMFPPIIAIYIIYRGLI